TAQEFLDFVPAEYCLVLGDLSGTGLRWYINERKIRLHNCNSMEFVHQKSGLEIHEQLAIYILAYMLQSREPRISHKTQELYVIVFLTRYLEQGFVISTFTSLNQDYEIMITAQEFLDFVPAEYCLVLGDLSGTGLRWYINERKIRLHNCNSMGFVHQKSGLEIHEQLAIYILAYMLQSREPRISHKTQELYVIVFLTRYLEQGITLSIKLR
ncbi:hypothetical protein CFP56_031730, partial [Quercus suber]